MTRIRIDLVLPSDYCHYETINQLNLSYPCDIYFFCFLSPFIFIFSLIFPLSSYLISTFPSFILLSSLFLPSPHPPHSSIFSYFPYFTIILTILKDLAAYILTVEIQSALDIVILRSPVHLDIVEGGERGGKLALLIVFFTLHISLAFCFSVALSSAFYHSLSLSLFLRLCV